MTIQGHLLIYLGCIFVQIYLLCPFPLNVSNAGELKTQSSFLWLWGRPRLIQWRSSIRSVGQCMIQVDRESTSIQPLSAFAFICEDSGGCGCDGVCICACIPTQRGSWMNQCLCVSPTIHSEQWLIWKSREGPDACLRIHVHTWSCTWVKRTAHA